MTGRNESYRYLNGRDGGADATPTGRYVNDFGSTLAARIRGVQQGDKHSVVKVYSTDNTCAGIHTTDGEIPEGAVLHWPSEDRPWADEMEAAADGVCRSLLALFVLAVGIYVLSVLGG